MNVKSFVISAIAIGAVALSGCTTNTPYTEGRSIYRYDGRDGSSVSRYEDNKGRAVSRFEDRDGRTVSRRDNLEDTSRYDSFEGRTVRRMP